jgi:twitching motility two-component system response regulator PilH
MDNEKSENIRESELENKSGQILTDEDLNTQDIQEINASIKEDNGEMSPPLESYPIVVIDDDRWIQRIFNQYLTNWGFQYVPASNSFEGLDVSIKSKPLIIFLDIIMPDVTGDITLKFIRGIEHLRETPVVIISGNLNKDVLKTTYKDGATGFISKPFTKEILFQKIKDVLDPKVYRRMVADGLMDPKLVKSTAISS